MQFEGRQSIEKMNAEAAPYTPSVVASSVYGGGYSSSRTFSRSLTKEDRSANLSKEVCFSSKNIPLDFDVDS
jgi:hypothetical protein